MLIDAVSCLIIGSRLHDILVCIHSFSLTYYLQLQKEQVVLYTSSTSSTSLAESHVVALSSVLSDIAPPGYPCGSEGSRDRTGHYQVRGYALTFWCIVLCLPAYRGRLNSEGSTICERADQARRTVFHRSGFRALTGHTL